MDPQQLQALEEEEHRHKQRLMAVVVALLLIILGTGLSTCCFAMIFGKAEAQEWPAAP